MVEWAVDAFFTGLGFRASLHLVVPGVILQFFPAVAHLALKTVNAPVLVVYDVVVGLPVGTGNGVEMVHIGLSAIVLPIMRVDAECLVVLGQVEGTPNSFEVEHVEIIIVEQVVDQFYDDIIFAVREAAVRTVVTILDVVRVIGTKLRLVLLWLVKLLHPVMRLLALVAERAGYLLFNVFAEIR